YSIIIREESLLLGQFLFVLGIAIAWSPLAIAGRKYPDKKIEEKKRTAFRAVFYSHNLTLISLLYLFGIKKAFTQEYLFWLAIGILVAVEVGLVYTLSKIEKAQLEHFKF
ncbi:MAG: hypothetical protein ACFB21_02065, partial [Opitutales bacterium]